MPKVQEISPTATPERFYLPETDSQTGVVSYSKASLQTWGVCPDTGNVYYSWQRRSKRGVQELRQCHKYTVADRLAMGQQFADSML